MRSNMARAVNSLETPLLGCACVFFLVLCGFDGPVLRHDWTTYPGIGGLGALLEQSTSPWIPAGFGSLSIYQPNFILSSILVLTRAFGSASLSFSIYLIVLVGISTFAVRRAIFRIGAASPGLRIGLCILFLFNPWTYTEVVAGHLYMILALALTLLLLVELCLSEVDAGSVFILLFMTLPQLQFFLINCVFVSGAAVVRRKYLLLLVPALCSLPILINVLGNQADLLATPHPIRWLAEQSVDPGRAPLLLGYFARYTVPLETPFRWAMILVFAGALAAFILCRKVRAAQCTAALTVTAVLLAEGLKGPLKAFAGYLFMVLPETNVYRELYDILGFALLGYIVLYALARSQSRLLFAPLALAIGTMIVAWAAVPPRNFWVPRGAVPVAAVVSPADTRFALFPAFQPLSFRGLGSGLDPDAFARGEDRYPINETFPRYPVQRALSEYAASGSTTDLQRLSVAEVIRRPYLAESAFHALSEGPMRHRGPVRQILSAEPELATAGAPGVGMLNRSLFANGVSFSDLTEELRRQFLPSVPYSVARRINASASSVDAHQAWVDASVIFAERPELAQPQAGAYTESPAAVLIVTGPDILASVDGRLLAQDGAEIVRASGSGFEWLRLPTRSRALRCMGRCLVTLDGIEPSGVNLEPSENKIVSAVPFQKILPWLLVAQVPNDRSRTLRYNATFTTGWTAYMDSAALPHFRFDGIANGWILPPRRTREQRLILIEQTAALEIACYLGLLGIVVRIGFLHWRMRSARS